MDVPALVACGAEDALCPPALHEEMAAALGVDCHVLDGCGHLASFEAPERVSRLGYRPSECAHVGDHHYADVIGAEAVGMSPVLIDRFEGPVPPEDAHRFVRTLDDLDRLLFDGGAQ